MIRNERKDDIDKLIQLKSLDTLREMEEMIIDHNNRINVTHLRVIKGARVMTSEKGKKSSNNFKFTSKKCCRGLAILK